VDIWRAAPAETQTLEFKEAKNQYDTGKLFGYCVAIANEGGGHLILGVKNKPPRDVVGTSAFPNPIVIAERIFQAVGFGVDIDEDKHSLGRVLVFSKLRLRLKPRRASFGSMFTLWYRYPPSLRSLGIMELAGISCSGL